MAASLRTATLAILVVASSACAPSIPEGRLACTDDSQCPDGWVCRTDLRCWSSTLEAAPSIRGTDAGTRGGNAGAGAGGARAGAGGRAGARAGAGEGGDTGESGAGAGGTGASEAGAGAAGAAGTDDPPPNPPGCDGCAIGDACYEADAPNPDNACEHCDPARSTSDWSDRDSAACDDGLFCTDGDACSGSTCTGSPRACGDGVDCNGQETCDEDADTCQPGSVVCPGGTFCNTAEDRCVNSCTTCTIGQSCLADGALNPTNPCLVCDVGRSATDWSYNDGAACGDGPATCSKQDTCMTGICRANHDGAGTSCGNAPTTCSDQDKCDGNGVCLANDKSSSTPCRAAIGPCDVGEFCNGGGACAVDTFKSSGTECAADSDPNTIDECNGSGSCVTQRRYCDQYRCWKIAPTGQTRCFNGSAIIACPGSAGAAACTSTTFCGQDAQYADPARAFVCKSSSGATKGCNAAAAQGDVVEDSLTTFVWQRDAPTDYGAVCGNQPGCQWEQAKQYCDTLTYAGQSDWRLPDMRTLMSLLNYGKMSPATDFPGTTQSTSYWTSSLYLDTGMHAHYVDFGAALNNLDLLTDPFPVRCVRGGSTAADGGANGRFYKVTSDPEPMIFDRATSLVWQGTAKDNVTWVQALAYCESLVYASKSDWRLPNQQEIYSLVDYDHNRSPTSDFPGTLSQDYWSSTTAEFYPTQAYTARFNYGYHTQFEKTSANYVSARCVRNYP